MRQYIRSRSASGCYLLGFRADWSPHVFPMMTLNYESKSSSTSGPWFSVHTNWPIRATWRSATWNMNALDGDYCGQLRNNLGARFVPLAFWTVSLVELHARSLLFAVPRPPRRNGSWTRWSILGPLKRTAAKTRIGTSSFKLKWVHNRPQMEIAQQTAVDICNMSSGVPTGNGKLTKSEFSWLAAFYLSKII